MSGYEIKRSLGSGSFGEVFHAKKAGHCYAVKKVRNTDPTARQEIRILSSVKHPHIIKYFEHYMEGRMMCIVLEYADQGTFNSRWSRETRTKKSSVFGEPWDFSPRH